MWLVQLVANPTNALFWVTVYGFYFIPPAAALFAVLAGPYYLWRRPLANTWVLVAIGAVSLLASSYVVPRYYNHDAVAQWTAGQVRLARKLSFPVFQPAYTVSGYTLVENTVNGLQEATGYDETYYITSTQPNPNVEASSQYQLTEQPASPNNGDYQHYCITSSFDSNIPSGDLGACTPENTNGVAWYRVNLQEHLNAGQRPAVGFVVLQGTIVVVRGTISPTETEKVIASLHRVDPAAIKFHNNWAIYQGGSQPILPTWSL